ncbi:MAG TPA: hypothetical protein VNG51_10115 [Ktedonobacteraceae bacterium]|nr:hypothetical protein [Ktedonobacteraceae bacterium]
MPFVSSAYAAFEGAEGYSHLQRSHVNVGYHPETGDDLLIPDSDRYAGTYILGVQGSGKSGLLEQLIAADITTGHAVIVIDPHGDLVMKCLSHIPPSRLNDTYLLDMEDEDYPFGVNIFSSGSKQSSVAQTQAVERLMHIFEVLWPDVLSQQNLPRYVRAAAITFLANPGATLVDMYRFLLDASVRAAMLQHVTDSSVRTFWQSQYDDLTPAERLKRVQPLIGRLEALFMGRGLVRNIIGQRRTTIDFRRAIEARQLIFVKLPLKTVPQDARLIGTIVLAQIHATIFSFADTPEKQRPGVSLYVDEFQHFATPDFNELFTEGRKFGVRLAIAHQYRAQLPGFLQGSTMTARTKMCFQTTPDDGKEMAYLFPSAEASVQPEDIDPHPTHYLLTRTPDDWFIRVFTETYLRPLQSQKRGNRVEIHLSMPTLWDVITGGSGPNPRIADPTPYLDSLLYQVMRSGNPLVPIPREAVIGFANCGRGFYRQALAVSDYELSAAFRLPPFLVVQRNRSVQWTRKPEGGREQLLHFLFHLRMVMQAVAAHPIGKPSTATPADVAKMLTSLPKRAAFVHSADTTGVIYTHQTPPPLAHHQLMERIGSIVGHTRLVYCHPRAEVERSFGGHVSAQPTEPTVTVRWKEVEP